jgi:hypothetical protein
MAIDICPNCTASPAAGTFSCATSCCLDTAAIQMMTAGCAIALVAKCNVLEVSLAVPLPSQN